GVSIQARGFKRHEIGEASHGTRDVAVTGLRDAETQSQIFSLRVSESLRRISALRDNTVSCPCTIRENRPDARASRAPQFRRSRAGGALHPQAVSDDRDET